MEWDKCIYNLEFVKKEKRTNIYFIYCIAIL